MWFLVVHRVWSVRYNHFHDQLVLTSSSDSRVILTNAMSISSEPFGHLVEDEISEEEHDDSLKDRYQACTSLLLNFLEKTTHEHFFKNRKNSYFLKNFLEFTLMNLFVTSENTMNFI